MKETFLKRIHAQEWWNEEYSISFLTINEAEEDEKEDQAKTNMDARN